MLLVWAGFLVFVLAMLALDLGVFHRTAHVVRVREALAWTGVWIALALLFSVFVYFGYENQWLGLGNSVDAVDGQINHGAQATVKYLTGYVIEKSLSVDNIFVIAVLFGFFAIPAKDQHRLLFWGILGALAMRGAMIGLGSALIARFVWILYIFGGVLIVTAIKMLAMKERQGDPSTSRVIRITRRFFPRLSTWGTALLTIELTDLVFAIDSIPAIFAITADPFLVFTSNVFAILGLRSLYFALAGAMKSFRYLKPALAIVLGVVGIKMLSHRWLKSMLGANFNLYLLALVLLILAGGVILSLLARRRDETVIAETAAR